MTEALTERLARALRQELAQALAALCAEVGAAESSVLLPADDTDLAFFASSNPALLRPDVPRVPIAASFSGIAFRTGQTVAVADAASQAAHHTAVDAAVATRTREFAAVPCAGLGVLTLVNRAAPDAAAARPFSLPELRRAEALAGEVAGLLAALPGLAGAAPGPATDPDLAADLARLDARERRVVAAVVGALLHNRDG